MKKNNSKKIRKSKKTVLKNKKIILKRIKKISKTITKKKKKEKNRILKNLRSFNDYLSGFGKCIIRLISSKFNCKLICFSF